MYFSFDLLCLQCFDAVGWAAGRAFNSLFSRTTCVSCYQKGKTSLDLNKARDGGVWGWQWHQVDHMQAICTCARQITTPKPQCSIFTGWMLFLMPSQQCHSTDG